MSIIINNSILAAAAYIGRTINAPEQRLAQGITGLPMQAVIDSHNNKADKETRIASVSRTIGKVIAGTTTGVLIRYAGILLLTNFTKFKTIKNNNDFIIKAVPKTKLDFLMPKLTFQEEEITLTEFIEKHKNYKKFVGTLFASLIMMGTNFAIDAPFTRYIDRKVKPKVREYFDNKEAQS